jgi:hypothetical protein
MDTKSLAFELNCVLTSDFLSLTLAGQSTTHCFPKYEAVTTDETEDCDYVDVNTYWKEPKGVEGDPFMTVEYNTGDKRYSYAMMEYEHATMHRGEISDPGGWEAGEYYGPFSSIKEMVKDMKQRIAADEARQKAETADQEFLKDVDMLELDRMALNAMFSGTNEEN